MERCVCAIEKMIKQSLPARYHSARLTDFSRPLCEAMAKWLAVPTDGIFIIGPTGCGKTHLMAAMLRMLYEQRKKATFRRATDLYLQVRHTYGGDTGLTETAILAGYRATPMLFLDDVASGSLSDHERRIALEVIDSRGNDARPTVVTSNLSLDEIRENMDERISSRLSGYTQLALTGKDRRRK